VNPTPASIQDVAGQFPVSEKFNLELQIQTGTQSNSTNSNPFAYWHGVQVRPWFHYDGVPNTTLTGSLSYIDYFNVPGTSNYKHSEWRLTTMGTLKQRFSGSSLYEQLRFELLNFRDSNAVPQHPPRLRFRLGQNLYLSGNKWRPYLGLYEEAILQFPKSSYSRVHFQGARFFAGTVSNGVPELTSC
jgi:hypothetical protein